MVHPEESAHSWCKTGHKLMVQGDWPAATNAFRSAVRIDPKFGSAHAGLGAALGNQGLWSLAVVAHERALALLPDDSDVLYNLGVAYGELRRASDAEECFRRVLIARPDDAETLTRLGVELVEQERFDEAIGIFDKVISAESVSTFTTFAYVSTAQVLFVLGRTVEARAALERACTLQPSLLEDRPEVAQLWKEVTKT